MSFTQAITPFFQGNPEKVQVFQILYEHPNILTEIMRVGQFFSTHQSIHNLTAEELKDEHRDEEMFYSGDTEFDETGDLVTICKDLYQRTCELKTAEKEKAIVVEDEEAEEDSEEPIKVNIAQMEITATYLMLPTQSDAGLVEDTIRYGLAKNLPHLDLRVAFSEGEYSLYYPNEDKLLVKRLKELHTESGQMHHVVLEGPFKPGDVEKLLHLLRRCQVKIYPGLTVRTVHQCDFIRTVLTLAPASN